jgi:2-polyprenyl-3-methyl-5-hydroxy-6-metoxy-1,4-benzoquinol methylase
VTTPERLRAAAVRAWFDARAATYRRATERGLWAWQRRREAAAIAAAAGEVRGLAALDFGCGAGFYASWLAERGACPVVAVDAAPGMIAQLDDPRIEAVVGDVADIDLGREFHLVLLAGVLEFACDAVAVLANARRHLAPGGAVVALLPPDNAAGRLYRRYHRRHGLEITLFGPGRVGSLAVAAGLMVATARPVPPYGVVYALAAR